MNKHECMTEKERWVKHEEGGLTRASWPSTVWCNLFNKMSCTYVCACVYTAKEKFIQQTSFT